MTHHNYPKPSLRDIEAHEASNIGSFPNHGDTFRVAPILEYMAYSQRYISPSFTP